jgi:hypothetical protein
MSGAQNTADGAQHGERGGAAVVVLLALVLALTALLSGASVALPGLIEAIGGTTHGAASMEFTVHGVVIASAAAVGAVVEVLRTRGPAQVGS